MVSAISEEGACLLSSGTSRNDSKGICFDNLTK